MNQAMKVFLACAIGAGLGALNAMEINHYFWWLGPIIGGIVGYLSYEWQSVVGAAKHAYKAASGWQPPSWRSIGNYVWLRVQIVILLFLFFGLFGAYLTLLFGLVLMPFVVPSGQIIPFLMNLPKAMWDIGCILGIGCTCMMTFPGFWINSVDGDLRGLSEEIVRLSLSLLVFPAKLVYWIVSGVWSVMIGVPRAIVSVCRFVKRFGWELFIRIHSEVRLLCGVDALLGATVGYFAGSAIVGAIAGGMLGVVNYAVVTERWLKPRGYIAAG